MPEDECCGDDFRTSRGYIGHGKSSRWRSLRARLSPQQGEHEEESRHRASHRVGHPGRRRRRGSFFLIRDACEVARGSRRHGLAALAAFSSPRRRHRLGQLSILNDTTIRIGLGIVDADLHVVQVKRPRIALGDRFPAILVGERRKLFLLIERPDRAAAASTRRSGTGQRHCVRQGHEHRQPQS